MNQISISVLATLLFTTFFFIFTNGATFEIRNECAYTVWAAASPGGGRRLEGGQAWNLNVPADDITKAKIWGRTKCNFDGSGRGHCETGDCGGVLECETSGQPPNTLAGFSLNISLRPELCMDMFYISLDDGFNIPMQVEPVNPGGYLCQAISCTADINGQCPNQLRAPGGCNNPCTVFKTNEYCCTDGRDGCGQTNFSRFFSDRCPDAHTYRGDEKFFVCPTERRNYRVIFCPTKSPHFPLEMVADLME